MNVDKHLNLAQANRAIVPDGNLSRPYSDHSTLLPSLYEANPVFYFEKSKTKNPTVCQNPTATTNHETFHNELYISRMHRNPMDIVSPQKKYLVAKRSDFSL